MDTVIFYLKGVEAPETYTCNSFGFAIDAQAYFMEVTAADGKEAGIFIPVDRVEKVIHVYAQDDKPEEEVHEDEKAVTFKRKKKDLN